MTLLSVPLIPPTHPPSNTTHHHHHPPSLKARPCPGLFVGLTFAECVPLHRGGASESAISSAAQWPLPVRHHPWSEEAVGGGANHFRCFLADGRCQPCYGFRFPLMARYKACVAALK